MLNVTEAVVLRWVREQAIPVRLVNDAYRFRRSDLLEWATSRGMRVSPDEFRGSDFGGLVQPHVSDALEAGGVHHIVGVANREAALRAVVKLVPVDAEQRDLLYDLMSAREALGSTGIGQGIAIPHVRNPLGLGVACEAITLCYLASPVEFDAIDGRPVDTIFSLVSGTIRSHLCLLSRLTAVLLEKGFREAVLRRASYDQILWEARRVEGALSRHPRPVVAG
jgi:PTS system nitrogen regulatory IIA component